MFIDTYPPTAIMKFEWRCVPRWASTITRVASGSEMVTRHWSEPLRTYTAPEAINCLQTMRAVEEMFLALAGPANSFPLRDPMDFASVPVTSVLVAPALSITDQVIGTGDGVTTQFQLKKTYAFGSATFERLIRRPVVSSVIVGLDGLPAESAPGGPRTVTVDRDGGGVSIVPAPDPASVVTAGFLFDVEVRFGSDDALETMVKSLSASGVADIDLFEKRFC